MASAARVTEAEVESILPPIDSSEDLTAFIRLAHLLVQNRLINCDKASEALKKEIERWLAAHFYTVRVPTPRNEKLGDAEVTFETGLSGEGLASTKYGQQALAIDPCGNLQTKRTAGIQTFFDLT